jgi:error-prone DNA polymerase
MYGIVRAHVAAKQCGVKLICGSTLTRSDGPCVTVLARNRAGYAALCQLISLGRHAADKGASRISAQQLLSLPPGDVFVIHPAVYLEPHLAALSSRFRGSLFAAVGRTMAPDDPWRLEATRTAARRLEIPMVVAPYLYFHTPERKALADVLTAIRRNRSVDRVGGELLPNQNATLMSFSMMKRLYHDLLPELYRTRDIADACQFNLDELSYCYPREVVPQGESPMSYLRQITASQARSRYGNQVPSDVQRQLQRELELIEELNYPNYFLTMYDIVQFARSRQILCQGRGSAANSAVCYVLGITSVDPVRSNLLFERFISRERNEPPDIDVDFEHDRREEVIQYIYERYGRHRASMVAVFIRYRTRSAIRDVGKALGMQADGLDRFSSLASSYRRDYEDWWERSVSAMGEDPTAPRWKAFSGFVNELRGFPRHLSIHVGGFVISDDPIHYLVPTEPARMSGRTVIQWDKEDVEDARLLKIDILALGMLSCLRRSFELLERHKRIPLTLATVPPEDPHTYQMIQKADTVGVFQIESRAQMSMLPRLQPRCFYDLVVEIALVRPGPIQGKMVHPYLRRRQGLEPVSVPLPELETVLGRTHGVPLFQEQVMKLAMVAAGFTAGEADNLRRAMGTWRTSGRLEGVLVLLTRRMEERGIHPDYARQIADQIKGFGEYGFPESHAASFALLAYASAWMKCHHPDVFTAALLNSLPMGFYPATTLLEDARRHGVSVLPFSVNHSHWDCSLEGPRTLRDDGTECLQIRLGMGLIRGLSHAAMEPLFMERTAHGAFLSVQDFVVRTGLSSPVLLKLALAGAFSAFDVERREGLWNVLGIWGGDSPLLEGTRRGSSPGFPAMETQDRICADMDATYVFQDGHPFEQIARGLPKDSRYHSARNLSHSASGQLVSVAGIILVRQRPPTANGTMFLTLEDHHGFVNVIVAAHILDRYRTVLYSEPMLHVTGVVQKEGDLIQIQAREIRGIVVTSRVHYSPASNSRWEHAGLMQ